jgi:heavy metal sensor kinase
MSQSFVLNKMPRMSLRNRIAIYYTIATSLLIALIFSGILFLVDRAVSSHNDDALMFEVGETITNLKLKDQYFNDLVHTNKFDDDSEDYINKIKQRNFDINLEFIQLVNHQGKVLHKSENLSTRTLLFKAGTSDTIYFNGRVEGSMLRHVQVPLVGSDGVIKGYLIVAHSLMNALAFLRELQIIFFFSFPVIVVTLFVLTRFIAGESIKPIDDVITTAEKITKTNLTQRIPLPLRQDELHRLSATINALLDRLQDAFQREQQFTADASHELNTPLSVVKGTLQVLLRKPRAIEHYEARIQFCLIELNRMRKIIDKLLVLALYEGNKISPNIEDIILPQLIDDVVARMQVAALEKNISITVQKSEHERVSADPAMLEMIFENILSNAIKYSQVSSAIIIAIEHNGSDITCSIADQGIGIPEQNMPKIFDRFYRVDESRNSKNGGVGVGLSIVKKLADLQQITLGVESKTNIGTTFMLTFLSA